MNSGIYTITNLINGKMYVGYTNNFSYREKQHFNQLRGNYHKNSVLQNAYNKYGKSAFKFEILEEIDYNIDIIISVENYWCNMLNTHNRQYGYNIFKTGSYMNSEDVIKMRLKSGISNKETWNNKYKEGYISKTNKPVIQYDLSNNFVKEYKSITIAAIKNNIKRTSISSCVRGYTKTCKGFCWKYKSQEILFKKSNISIYQYDLDGNFIKYYESIHDIKDFCYSNILKCADNIVSNHKKYIFTRMKMSKNEILNRKINKYKAVYKIRTTYHVDIIDKLGNKITFSSQGRLANYLNVNSRILRNYINKDIELNGYKLVKNKYGNNI